MYKVISVIWVILLLCIYPAEGISITQLKQECSQSNFQTIPSGCTTNLTCQIGPQGPQGIQGVNGTPGETGPQGIQGINGTQGIQGETGPQGINGTPGETGPQGIQGIQGIQGETGPQGINGTPGETGPQGIQGIQGIQGEIGPQGIQGINGTPGEQGPQGLQGPPGPMGPENQTVTDLSWNTSYYLRSLTQPLTGYQIYRDMTTSGIYFCGGTGCTNGTGANLIPYGSDHGSYPGQIRFSVPNAAASGVNVVMHLVGMTDTPYLHMDSHQIKNVADPTSAQDVATKNYVDLKFKRGSNSVADGGTITHGFGSTPTSVIVTGTNSSQCYTVNTIGATTFKVAVKRCAAPVAGVTDTVNWMVS